MIVVDTSAILAILLAEPEGEVFRERIAEARGALVSAVSAVELAAVASRDDALFDAVQSLLNEPYVEIVPVDAAQTTLATDAYRRYGKGRHPAGLNLGDVFSYALARARELPLLFKGNDFSQTDVGHAHVPHSAEPSC